MRKLVGWLEAAGHSRITLLDNASSFPPLLEYLEATPHQVVRLPNLGSRSLWVADLVPDEPFVLTDPDLVPIDNCPNWLIDHMAFVLDRGQRTKVGVGLYLADVPTRLPSYQWELELVSTERQRPDIAPHVYDSLVDTTFALYKPGAHFEFEAYRLGWPYQMRHSSWYVNPGWEDEEDRYYLAHAEAHPLASSWAIGYEERLRYCR